jgi:preprotein translocase subunit Sec61beta
VKFPRGLIRYASNNGIMTGQKIKVTPRIVIYTVILCILTGLLSFLLATRTEVETNMLRAPGTLYQTQPNGDISNLYLVKLMNKTTRAVPVELTPGINRRTAANRRPGPGGSAARPGRIRRHHQPAPRSAAPIQCTYRGGGLS